VVRCDGKLGEQLTWTNARLCTYTVLSRLQEVDGKKKKKGTLGVGNGSLFFASDSDKVRSFKSGWRAY
jgi:hypothetical protein